ncbi:universal stress protein [Aliikangiella sp. IMCC44359]|uniref:universal stress protein n=1 Tax=Aliikangiella sp. IMCC44359 TaxID=3459125 RepID=UPI00403AFDB5
MRELLVIADRKGGNESAFHHALEIARNTGAVIEYVGFVHAPGVDSSEILSHEDKRKVHRKYTDEKQAQMDAFLETVDVTDIKIKTDVVWERSFERWVIARCKQKSFDMVFKSGHRSETFLYTPSDWQLMRHCPEAVMIVGKKEWKEGGVLLAALDLGSNNKRTLQLNEDILNQTIKLAEATKSEVHACYSIAVPKALADLDLIDPKEYESKMKASLDPVIRKLVDDAGLNRKRLHLVSGKPAKEICRISQKIDADVVIIGNKTRTSLRGRMMGNTAESVLHKVSADVVVIK